MNDLLQGTMIAIHGPPKVGKTQLASKFPGPVLWLATEIGHKFIPEDQRKNLVQLAPEIGWSTFIDVVSGQQKIVKPKTIVIDTISGLYDLCMLYTCGKNKWDHPSDGPHGKGWSAVKDEFFRGLTKLTYLADKAKATIIFIDHSKIESIETTTANIEKVTFAMPGQARGIVLKIPDHMWFLGYAGDSKNPNAEDGLKNTESNRALWVGGNNAVEAGCRDPNVNKVRCIVPLSKKDPYNQILKELYGDRKE